MKTKHVKVLKLTLILLIIATLAFIFTQSMLPPEKSSAESGAVGDIIGEIIPPDTEVGEYVQTNIRKIAHFVEFATLGSEVALYIVVLMPKLSAVLLSFPVALIMALLDETIQIFSGRGPSITDVWIDFAGFASTAVIFYTAYTIIILMRRKCKQ